MTGYPSDSVTDLIRLSRQEEDKKKGRGRTAKVSEHFGRVYIFNDSPLFRGLTIALHSISSLMDLLAILYRLAGELRELFRLELTDGI